MSQGFSLQVDFSDTSDAEAVLVHWIYEPGAFVRQGEIVAEAMVDKVTLSVESPQSGYLNPIIKENDTFSSGTIIAYIAEESSSQEPHSSSSARQSRQTSEDKFVPVSPRVRKYAADKHVDLLELARGIAHRPLRVEDVDVFLSRQEAVTPQPYSIFRRQLIRNLTDPEALPTTLMRRIHRGPESFSPLVQIAWGVDQALRRHPEIHGWSDSQGFMPASELRLGIAMATAEGLMVPVVMGSHDGSGWDQALRALRHAAQAGTLDHLEMGRPSFVISNLGPWGIEYFTPRLMIPTVAILGVGQADADSFPVSLTFDHRGLDGVEAARFLVTLDEVIQSLA